MSDFRRHAVAVAVAAERIADRREAAAARRARGRGAAPRHRQGSCSPSSTGASIGAADDGRRESRTSGSARAPRARHRSRARRRGAGPPLGPLGDRGDGDRATPHAGGRRTRGGDPARRPDRPPRGGDRSPPNRCVRLRPRSGSTTPASTRCSSSTPTRASRAARPSEPCPLSARELDALRGLGRGQGLQADRPGALALGEHGPHPPAQRLSEDRRGRPRPGRPDRPRSRLALSPRSMTGARARSRAPGRAALLDQARCGGRSRPRGHGRAPRGGRGRPWCGCAPSRR